MPPYNGVRMKAVEKIVNKFNTIEFSGGTEFNQQIPIIALSADVLRHEIDSDEMASFTGGLAKPIDTDLLHATFARFLPTVSTQN